MTAAAHDGSGIDGAAYLDVMGLVHRAPGWFDSLVTAWSLYGLALFVPLMLLAWWRARRAGTPAVVGALAVPLITLLGFGADALLKSAVREDRPCRTLGVRSLEACPGPGDWSFPSNHAALAAAAAVALVLVSRGIGAVALAAAVLMAASRVWVGVHYPHDALAGLLMGALVALPAGLAVRHRQDALARWLGAGPLRPLLSPAV